VYIIDIYKYILSLIKLNSNVENIISKDTNDYLGDKTILNLKTQMTSRLFPFSHYIALMHYSDVSECWDKFIPIEVPGLCDTVRVFAAVILGKRVKRLSGGQQSVGEVSILNHTSYG